MPKLKPHQVEGARWLAARHSALLANDVGSGKTAQVVASMDETNPSKTLIVCPPSAIPVWLAELDKWSAKKREIYTPLGRNLPFDRGSADDPAVFVVSNASTFPSLIKSAATLGKLPVFDLAVIDEAHHFKNPETARVKALAKVGARRRYALTATPITNEAADMFPVLRWLDPDPSRVWSREHPRAADPGAIRADMAEAGFLMRRKKADALPDLPATRDIHVRVDMPKALRQETRDTLDALGLKGDGFELGDLIEKQSGLLTVMAAMSVAKLDAAKALIGTLTKTGEPLVVFSTFRATQLALNTALKNEGRRVRHFGSQLSTRDRGDLVAEFQNGEHDILVCGMRVAGESVTLTRARQCLFIDLDFRPALLRHAAQRVHRIGQTRPCDFYFLVGDIIDEAILRHLASKASTITRILD